MGFTTTMDTIDPSSNLPKKFKQLFDYSHFNDLQSKMFPHCYSSNSNLVISAPTASGKTVLFEFALLSLLKTAPNRLKAIYIAPLKAIVSQRHKEWHTKFSKIGLFCGKLSSEEQIEEDYKIFGENHILVSTAEKLDILTRKWVQFKKHFEQIKLVIIDEVHSINGDRGGCLEALVTRLKILLKDRGTRFIAASATIPNISDVAAWLSAKPFAFGNAFRPVPLDYHVKGVLARGRNSFLFDKNLDFLVYPAILRHGSSSPVLVFCNSRRSAENCAEFLRKETEKDGIGPLPENAVFFDRNNGFGNGKLRDLAKFGVAFHHGGLEAKDRNLVEKLFLRRGIRIVCCTSTLSQGINLPAHLVIVKSTEMYSKSEGYKEYSKSEVIQMIGRAGRPQFSQKGVAVIFTRREMEEKYKTLFEGCEAFESNLMRKMAEHLLVEIAIRGKCTRKNLENWLKETFLFVRATKNPAYYGLNSSNSNRERTDVVNVCLNELDKLVASKLVSFDGDANTYKAQRGALIMNKYYLKFNTMTLLMSLNTTLSLKNSILRLSSSDEFSSYRIRFGEKKVLNKANRNLKFPIIGRIVENAQKVSLLLQLLLSVPARNELLTYELRQDQVFIRVVFSRVLAGLIDYAISTDCGNWDFLWNLIKLKQSVYNKKWFDSKSIPKQTKISDFSASNSPFGHRLQQVKKSFQKGQCLKIEKFRKELRLLVQTSKLKPENRAFESFFVFLVFKNRVLFARKLSLSELENYFAKISVRSNLDLTFYFMSDCRFDLLSEHRVEFRNEENKENIQQNAKSFTKSFSKDLTIKTREIPQNPQKNIQIFYPTNKTIKSPMTKKSTRSTFQPTRQIISQLNGKKGELSPSKKAVEKSIRFSAQKRAFRNSEDPLYFLRSCANKIDLPKIHRITAHRKKEGLGLLETINSRKKRTRNQREMAERNVLKNISQNAQMRAKRTAERQTVRAEGLFDYNGCKDADLF